jgi:hypothetical protein
MFPTPIPLFFNFPHSNFFMLPIWALTSKEEAKNTIQRTKQEYIYIYRNGLWQTENSFIHQLLNMGACRVRLTGKAKGCLMLVRKL